VPSIHKSSDVLNWNAGSITAGVMAHEFGHYLGLYDEYIGGGIDKYPNPTLSTAIDGNRRLTATLKCFHVTIRAN
jgi:hypothetical protein